MSKYYANQRPLSKEHPVWRTGLPPRLLERLAPLGERLVMRHIHQPFRRLRQRYGLSIKQTYRDELEGDLTCICDSPLLFPQHRLPTHYRVIGPLFHVGPEPEIALLHRLYAHKPTIVLTMGSTGALAPFRLLARPEFADFNIVVAGEAEKDFQAPHVTALPFVNLAAVLPHADLVICHGGNGTVNQALAQGVPVLCSPTFFEQEWNAQRVAQLGLGACIDPPKDVGMFKRLLLHWIAQKGQPRFVDVATHLQVADSLARFREAVEEKWMVADKG